MNPVENTQPDPEKSELTEAEANTPTEEYVSSYVHHIREYIGSGQDLPPLEALFEGNPEDKRIFQLFIEKSSGALGLRADNPKFETSVPKKLGKAVFTKGGLQNLNNFRKNQEANASKRKVELEREKIRRKRTWERRF